MNLCRSCGKDFGSISAFDAHRTGKHALDYPEYENGRRCSDDEEMAAGFHQDSHGRWRQNITAKRLSDVYAIAETRRKGAADA